MRTSHRQLGFAPIVVLVAVASLALVVGAGWLLYQRSQDKSTQVETSKQITSFEECVAAGNPVMESYPERCAANGQSFTKKIESPSTTQDPSTNWLLFTPDSKRYSIRLPDGWNAVTMNNNLYVRESSKMIYKAGSVAVITPTESGWDGGSPFALYDPGSYADQIVREGDEVGTMTTTKGLTVHKYVYNQTTEPEAIGYPKGSKVYNYYFDAPGKFIQVSHMITPGAADQSEWVEKAIATITVN